jgi:hypothetical protein
VGYEGWEACAVELFDLARDASSLELLLAGLRHLDVRGTPRLHQCDNEPEREEDAPSLEGTPSLEDAPSVQRLARPNKRRDVSADELPPALRAVLVERFGCGFGGESPARQPAKGRTKKRNGGGKPREPDYAALPLATLPMEPTWVATSKEVTALHVTLCELATSTRREQSAALRLGVDTEWADSAEEETGEPSVNTAATHRPPPRVAVVQLAVDDQVWVIDALAAGPETGLLLVWALACNNVALLGFAFRGDLAMLRPLCGAHALVVSSLIDVQTLAMRPGEDTPSLQRVCARSMGVRVDKTQQCSDWARRPLEREQFIYAALDAHILLGLHERLSTKS